MKCACVLLLILYFSGIWRLSRTTCVLESDFGFVLNCAFKKSGLFRVRNLGGIKAHIGLGFSVGDELGFKESISNVEINRRRSAQASRFQAALAQAQNQAQQANAIKVRSPIKNDELVQSTTTVPPFKPIPPAPERPSVPTIIKVNGTKLKMTKNELPSPAIVGVALPQTSISRLSNAPTVYSPKENVIAVMVPVSKNKATDKMSNNFALRTLSSQNNNNDNNSNEFPPPLPHTNSNSVNTITATNISDETSDVGTTKGKKHTTIRPHLSHKHSSSYGKVMNAPKEYYPVGYDKNFDDNFASRVELPDTSFYCGDQKHFPGLYADEDLGCMVFHVCALTDDGLIMKSFLCPESTLFDQTILKCNWWFYVDCKSSKKLYDSNIPISKSYQLMKALTFFSAYKNEASQQNQQQQQQQPKTTDKD